MIETENQSVESDNTKIEQENTPIETNEIPIEEPPKIKTPKKKPSKVPIPEHVKPESDTEPKTPKKAAKKKIVVKVTPINAIEEKAPEPSEIERQTADEPVQQQKTTVPFEQFLDSLPKPDVPDKPPPKRGHRPKKLDKENVREKTTCPDCGKTVSVHSIKYTHKRYCKKKQPPEEELPPPIEEKPSLENKVLSKSKELKMHKDPVKPRRTTFSEMRVAKIKQLASLGLP
jgi:hypothetical protein